jgi:hypothetical protein
MKGIASLASAISATGTLNFGASRFHVKVETFEQFKTAYGKTYTGAVHAKHEAVSNPHT